MIAKDLWTAEPVGKVRYTGQPNEMQVVRYVDDRLTYGDPVSFNTGEIVNTSMVSSQGEKFVAIQKQVPDCPHTYVIVSPDDFQDHLEKGLFVSLEENG